MIVTHAYDRALGAPQRPSDAIPEGSYRPAPAPAPRYVVRFDDGGRAVELRRDGGEPMRGRLEADAAGVRRYELTAGTFAGGRFVVTAGDGGASRAELTVYGSGVPVVRSERGDLAPAR